MSLRRWCPRVVLLSMGLGPAGCASAGSAGAGIGREPALIVENRLIPATTLRISVLTSDGLTNYIGTVNPGRTDTLRFDPPGSAGSAQFVAEIPLGREIRSNPVSFSPGESIRWDVSANIATIAEPE